MSAAAVPAAVAETGRGLRLALFQAAQCRCGFEDRLAQLEAGLGRSAEARADLLVTPELFLTGYGDEALTLGGAITQDGPEMDRISALARCHGLGLVLGYPERADGVCYNAAAVFDRDGCLVAHYRKEFLPNAYERGCFTQASAPSRFRFGGLNCALLICYDVEFPEKVRELALSGADLVIVPTALPERWKIVADTIIPARAYENGVFVAYCNFSRSEGGQHYAGRSTVCGPAGEVLAQAGVEDELLLADLDRGAIEAQRARLDFLGDFNTSRFALPVLTLPETSTPNGGSTDTPFSLNS